MNWRRKQVKNECLNIGVKIQNIKVSNNKISADVIVNNEHNYVWYEFPKNQKLSERPANAFLVIFLPIAMKFGGIFEINGEISKSLYNNTFVYQDILLKWFPELKRVTIKANKISKDINYTKKRKTISCFTGGVDAFYTLIKNNKKINDLLYVWGFDIPLTEEKFFNKVKKHLSSVAKKFNKDIIFVKTNLGFEVTNKYASWGNFCYGPAIASVLLLMSENYNYCYMPSCNDYSVLVPRGSHIIINYLWNCDGLKFIYDGAEASRIEKVDFISDNDEVRKNLRVCYSSNDKYNCCKCEKCIRTMASLEALDKSGIIKTFPEKLNVKEIDNIELKNDSEMNFAKDTMIVALKNQKLELAKHLNYQIMNYKSNLLFKEINENFDTISLDKDFSNKSKEILLWHIDNNTKYVLNKTLKTTFKKIFKKFYNLIRKKR